MGIWRPVCINEYTVCVLGGWAGFCCSKYSDKSILTEVISIVSLSPVCMSGWQFLELTGALGWDEHRGSCHRRDLEFSLWIFNSGGADSVAGSVTHRGMALAELGSCSSSVKWGFTGFEFPSLACCGCDSSIPTVPMVFAWQEAQHCSEICISHGTAWPGALLIQR